MTEIRGFEAILMSTIAGLGTGLGGVLVVYFVGLRQERTIGKLQVLTEALSAGVMLYISIFDIIPEAFSHLDSSLKIGLCFFIGMSIMALLERLVPEDMLTRLCKASSSEFHDTDRSISEVVDLEGVDGYQYDTTRAQQRIIRAGWITFVGMALHNAPEGVAVYLSTMKNVSFGLSLAFAIACHNIPEGMAVAIPLYFATKNKLFTIQLTILNGLFEPLAVLLCSLFFGWDPATAAISESFNAAILSGVAGIMTFISLHELYPSAIEYNNHRGNGKDIAMSYLVLGMTLGFGVMSLASLLSL